MPRPPRRIMPRRRPSMRSLRWVLVSLTVTGILAGPVPTAGAAFPGTEGRIAFVRKGDIWTMEPDGSDQVRLTWNGSNGNPMWSPDGSRIAFDRWTSADGLDLWVMNADGSAKYRVTKRSSDESDPAWSPTGRRLAFVSDRRGRRELFTIGAMAPFGHPRRLTDAYALEDPWIDHMGDFAPAWSPLGDAIAFTRVIVDDPGSFYGWAYVLRIVDPGTKAVTEVAAGIDGPVCPAWSPYGRRLAVQDSYLDYDHDPLTNNVWTMLPDGSSRVQVTHFAEPYTPGAGCPAWSPDAGRRIVVAAAPTETSEWDIYLAPSGGQTDPLKIATNGTAPDWQPI